MRDTTEMRAPRFDPRIWLVIASALAGVGVAGAAGATEEDPFARVGGGDSELSEAQRERIRSQMDALRSRGPIEFPPSRAGYPGEVRDARDIAPYLAWHQAWAATRVHEALGGGADGSGRDAPTSNQDLYDALYYGLDLTINPTTANLVGVTTVRVKVVSGPLTTVELNLATNLTVASVTSGGVPATFTRPANLLSVTLDQSYATDEVIEIVVTYSGNPASGDAWGWDSEGGQPMIWTLSQPFGARTWFPCKDHPEDKADSVDVEVTMPTGHRIASNGVLRAESDNGTNSYAWWHESHPIATYLVSLAIHPYTVTTDWFVSASSDSTELVFYDFPANAAGNAPANGLVNDMMGVFEDRFGAYPFADEKYGHAEFPWPGGMEHQTCSSMGAYFESITAHELMHQWFGDAVTCRTFEHVWLNEGFASYGEALWQEAAYGTEAYHQDMALTQFFGPGTIYCPPTENFGIIFDSNLRYNKASWVLHMLRHVVGDTDFFAGMSDYFTTFSGGAADTEDFRDVMEAASGVDLDTFFQQWIYGEGAPIYTYEWSSAPAGGGGWDVSVGIDQVQSGQVFTMPIDVMVETVTGPEVFVVTNDAASESYVLHVDDEPLGVQIDPEKWILRIVIAPIAEPSFTKDILLVNGVEWATYGAEITSSYDDKAFWGTLSIDFWDYFDAPGGGYPSTLPAPLGHGPVPGNVLGQYRNVIWVGNNFGGDLDGWHDTPLYSYLQAGGNVLLLTRQGETFLVEPYRNYLGVTWLSQTTITDCIAQQPGLSNIGRVGTQSLVATFQSAVAAPSILLYEAEAGFTPDRGIGVYQQNPGGGEFNPTGGKFAFLSGRPYRWNHAALATNVEYVIRNYFGGGVADAPDGGGAAGPFSLEVARPNPFSGSTVLTFTLPSSGPVRLRVLDVTGREVRSLASGVRAAGQHRVTWDGVDVRGESVSSGVYFVRLEAADRVLQHKVLRVR